MKTHPIQPVDDDGTGVLRFKGNAIVRHLLDACKAHGLGLNELAQMDFSREDREQFAQLIGYSLSGAHDLDYMSDEVLGAAERMLDDDKPEDAARIDELRAQLDTARNGMRAGVAALFGIHPDDLAGGPEPGA